MSSKYRNFLKNKFSLFQKNPCTHRATCYLNHMSKKYFIALANMIRASRAHNPNSWRQGEVRELAEFLRSQNPNFNADLWFDYLDGKCGPSGGKIK